MIAQVAGSFLVASLVVQAAQIAPSARSHQQPAPIPSPGLFDKRAVNPYDTVFVVPAEWSRAKQEGITAPVRDRGSRVRCGIVVIDADPRIDPKIFVSRKGDEFVNPDPKMVIPIPPCPDDKR